MCTELGKSTTSEAGKYLFRAANRWCRGAQYFCYCPLVPRCLEIIAVCIWRMFVLCLL